MPNTPYSVYQPYQQFQTAPPDIQAGASQIFQQQKLAELLRQQAMTPIKADEYSKTGSGQWAAPPQIVKVGMGQGLAKLAEAGVGGYMQNKANEDQLALANQLRGRRSDAISDITTAMEGRPATQGYDAVAGYNTGGDTPGMVSTYEDGTPQPVKDIAPQAAIPGQAAVPPADRKTLAAMLMGSEFQDLQKVGEYQLFTKPEGYNLKPGEVRFDGNNQQVAAAPQKTQYENASNLNRLMSERADIAAANPADERLKAYDNAIRKESETARQITPVIKMPSQGHIVQTDNGFMSVKDGVATPVLNAAGEPIAGKGGTLNLAGGRESVQIGRVIQASNQAAKDLENVAQLPITSSSGIFGGRSQGPSLFEAGKESLTNKMTTQDVQTYNVMIAGMQRNLAAIESAGLMPPGSLTKQMDAVVAKEGDTQLTKMHKLAQTRQIIEAAKESMDANPRIAPEQKAHMDVVLGRVEKAVPYTHQDLMQLDAAQQKNPKASLASIKAAKANTGPAVGSVQDGYKFKGGDPSKPESWEKM